VCARRSRPRAAHLLSIKRAQQAKDVGRRSPSTEANRR
jgi:hypothetical protein